MFYTLGQAAKATGTSKPTLSRAIKSGRLSGQKQPDGSYLIDPAELHRVYPPVVATSNDNGNAEHYETPNNPKALQAELDAIREERERERRQLQATVDDLRGERDRLLKVTEEQAGTVKQLTYQPKAEPEPPPPTPAAFLGASWQWWVALILAATGGAGAWFLEHGR
jgi:hypothetical protein